MIILEVLGSLVMLAVIVSGVYFISTLVKFDRKLDEPGPEPKSLPEWKRTTTHKTFTNQKKDT